jgi:hypothetical protein
MFDKNDQIYIGNAVNRVTTMGEFSPNELMLTVGRFSKIREVAQIFGLLFSTVKAMYQF